TSDEKAAARNDDGTFKKLSKGQKRFQELEHERDTYRSRAESAQERAERVERELAEYKRQAAPREPERATPQTPEPAPERRPKPREDEVGVKYQSYADFTEDLADWKAEERELKVRADFDRLIADRIEADRAGQRFSSQLTEIVTRGRE